MAKSSEQMEKIVALCKRRGFIFQSSEIYGGIGGFWDYGPLGVELKRNIKDAWWQDMVTNPPDGPDGKELQMVGLDASIIMNPKVWEASGHVGGFADPMVEDNETKQRFRADQLQSLFFLEPDPDMTVGKKYLVASSPPAPNQIPDKTVIANSPTDALSLLSEDRALRKLCGVREVKSQAMSCVSRWDLNYSTMWVETHTGHRYAYARSCSTEFLQHYAAQTPSPFSGKAGTLSEPRSFNLMYKTFNGALEDSASQVYLRPETAQGIFVNFKNVCDSTRVKVPFGIAQVGKAFRNEINPRNYTFRSREFEQMEIEFFCHDADAMTWWEWWRDVRINWYVGLGLASDNLRPRNQGTEELAHYSKACTDIEYCFPFADEPQELEGVAHRGCYDLEQHQKHSGKPLAYFDDEKKERFLPTVIEPSAGADRSMLAFICEAYSVDESRPSPELMRFHPRLAPIKAAVFPLVNKDGLPEIAEPIYRALKKRWPVAMDVKGSIGKRYARMDEAGTPYCFTIDGQTKEDGTVTVRDRDTGGQDRIDKSRVGEYLADRLSRAGA